MGERTGLHVVMRQLLSDLEQLAKEAGILFFGYGENTFMSEANEEIIT